MTEIAAILEALRPALATRHFRQLVLIVEATLSMTGRVTMLSIARWTEEGGAIARCSVFLNSRTTGQSYVGC